MILSKFHHCICTNFIRTKPKIVRSVNGLLITSCARNRMSTFLLFLPEMFVLRCSIKAPRAGSLGLIALATMRAHNKIRDKCRARPGVGKSCAM